METFMGQVYNPHLKKVLKTYQLSAPKSLQGPSSVLTEVAKKEPAPEPSPEPFTTPPPLPIQQLPILTAPDRSPSQRCETNLHGESITCFLVGGEKRLCLPQLLHSILRDFTYAQINAVCDNLQIFCSRCNQEQLEELKETGVLPKSAPSCGLITKTDAERLCSALLHRPVAAPRSLIKTAIGIKVYHECFGKCRGVLFPELFADSESPCVECLECQCLLSPRQYVCHSHHPPENRTCHWGFDSDNWRVYVLLHRDQPDVEEREKLLETVKNSHVKNNNIKQLLESMVAKGDWAREPDRDWEKERERERERDRKEEEVAVKKMKLDDGAYEVPAPPAAYLQPYDAAAFQYYWYDPYMRSAFRPWHHALHIDEKAFAESVPAYLSHDPPVLLHPERVVPMSDSERFERSFQPNVALAPRTDHRRNELKSESVIREEKKPIPKDRKPYNPEIELSTDTDDSTSDQHETGTAVEQVATVFAALSDAKETTRELVVSLVERLAGRLESLEAENRRLRKDNLALQQQISKELAELRERLSNGETDEKNGNVDEATTLENSWERDREHRPSDGKPDDHGQKQGKIVERDKTEETESTNRVSPISPVPSSSEVKLDLVAPHVSVVRSSPVSVITSQASIKMEPLSE